MKYHVTRVEPNFVLGHAADRCYHNCMGGSECYPLPFYPAAAKAGEFYDDPADSKAEEPSGG